MEGGFSQIQSHIIYGQTENGFILLLGHSNWITSFPLLDVTTSMRAGGLLLLLAILLFT